MIVDDDAAALGDGEITVAAEGILRANAGGEDHHIHFKLAAIGEGEAVFRLLAAMHQDPLVLLLVYPHAHGFNLAAQQLAAPDRRAARPSAQEQTHHVGLETQRLEGTGGFGGQADRPRSPPRSCRSWRRCGYFRSRWCDRRRLVVLTARNGRHPGWSCRWPAPVLSYPTTVPLLECTSRLALSIFFTASPSSRRMPCLS